ncbi:MAG: hypothetical protein PHD81_04955 [Candidatus Nanoarchaeia archaeon]|nr:hypothetical protein [Candidatus Nanoarchaeia archaeon]MDD5588427.1 hypothetical protein [Candidatus Nanoarchaeia archaeon]
MKKAILYLIFAALLVNLVFAFEEVIGYDPVANYTTSVELKDIVLDSKAIISRNYNENIFNIDGKAITKINGHPIVHLSIPEEPIIITPKQIFIGNQEVNILHESPIVSPKLVYNLSRNIRIIQVKNENSLFLDDNKINFSLSRVKVNKGILYVNEEEIPFKVMPFQAKNTFRYQLETYDNPGVNIEYKEVKIDKKKVWFIYTTESYGKILFIWDIKVPLELKVNAITGNLDINKPLWAIFVFGENKNLDDVVPEVQ